MNPEYHPSSTKPNPDTWNRLTEVPFAGETENPPIPTTSPDKTCNQYLRAIDKFNHRMEAVQDFIKDAAARNYDSFDSESLFSEFGTKYSTKLDATLDAQTKSELKNYSGYNYRPINQVARGQWDYETSGECTPEKLAAAQQTIELISHSIASSPTINLDFTTYRGTNLDGFHGYNISSISDLNNLKGQFFLEQGFTSTSFSPDKSFAGREFDDPLRQQCNINITYRIPKESHDGIGLLSDETSYSPEQQEYLINHNSLSYISKVSTDTDNNTANLEMILIPKEIYDSTPTT